MKVETHYLKKRSIDSNLPPSSEEWIGIAHDVIVPLILPQPSSRPQLLGILETSPLPLPESLREEKATLREARKDSTPVTSVNMSGTYGEARKDLSQVTCYNCREKGHYVRNCFEPQRHFRGLITVSTTIPITTASKESTLDIIPCTQYLV